MVTSAMRARFFILALAKKYTNHSLTVLYND